MKSKLKLSKETLANMQVQTGVKAGGTVCSNCTHLTALCDTTGNTNQCRKG